MKKKKNKKYLTIFYDAGVERKKEFLCALTLLSNSMLLLNSKNAIIVGDHVIQTRSTAEWLSQTVSHWVNF